MEVPTYRAHSGPAWSGLPGQTKRSDPTSDANRSPASAPIGLCQLVRLAVGAGDDDGVAVGVFDPDSRCAGPLPSPGRGFPRVVGQRGRRAARPVRQRRRSRRPRRTTGGRRCRVDAASPIRPWSCSVSQLCSCSTRLRRRAAVRSAVRRGRSAGREDAGTSGWMLRRRAPLSRSVIPRSGRKRRRRCGCRPDRRARRASARRRRARRVTALAAVGDGTPKRGSEVVGADPHDRHRRAGRHPVGGPLADHPGARSFRDRGRPTIRTPHRRTPPSEPCRVSAAVGGRSGRVAGVVPRGVRRCSFRSPPWCRRAVSCAVDQQSTGGVCEPALVAGRRTSGSPGEPIKDRRIHQHPDRVDGLRSGSIPRERCSADDPVDQPPAVPARGRPVAPSAASSESVTTFEHRQHEAGGTNLR